ncbi:hypothetical protein EON63_00240 [archaeon]|nr:MAG: hypothetical protein EON63_00240 [archaeon]
MDAKVALELDRTNVKAWYAFAHALLGAGKYEPCLAACHNGLEYVSDDPVGTEVSMFMCLCMCMLVLLNMCMPTLLLMYYISTHHLNRYTRIIIPIHILILAPISSLSSLPLRYPYSYPSETAASPRVVSQTHPGRTRRACQEVGRGT